jgi:hypothetical protein
MTHLIDDYLREVETSLRVDAARKRQIVDELRTHLTEKADEVSAADPERPRAQIEQEMLREFGNPRDLALAYEPEGTAVLTNQAGEIVLRLGKAVGRGAAAVGRGSARALKWVAIALAALLVVALGVGAWAYYEVKPFIPAIIEQSEPTYQYFERCVATPCSGAAPADTFYVRGEATTVRLDLNVYSVHTEDDWDRHVGNGSVRIVVTDPAGEVRYDRSLNVTEEGATFYETSWTAVEGNWTIAYSFDAFVGAIDVETYAIGFPWGER